MCGVYFNFAINYSLILTNPLQAMNRHRRIQIFLALTGQQGEHMLNNKKSGRFRAVAGQDYWPGAGGSRKEAWQAYCKCTSNDEDRMDKGLKAEWCSWLRRTEWRQPNSGPSVLMSHWPCYYNREMKLADTFPAKSTNEPDVPLQSRLLSSLVFNSKRFAQGHWQMRNIHSKGSPLSFFDGFHWAGWSSRTSGLGLNWMKVSLLQVGLLKCGGHELSFTPPFPQLDVSGLSHQPEDTLSEQRWKQRLRSQWKQGKDVFMVINEPGLGHN